MARSKYGNVPTAGSASKRESRRAAELRLLERAGKIRNLREQVKFVLIPAQYINGKCVERACTYTADFVYEEGPRWDTICEDSKGYPNDRWAMKRKLMLQVHGFRVAIV